MASGVVTVDVVGDLIIDRRYPRTAFEHVRSLLDENDLLVGNLEGPLCRGGDVDALSELPVQMDTETVEAFVDAGFDLLSLANNHTMDYGPEGLQETMDVLARNGIRHVGAGETIGDARAPATFSVGDVDVGFVAAEATPYSVKLTTVPYDGNPGINKLTVDAVLPEPHLDEPDLTAFRQMVADAAADVDILVPVIHFGIADTETIPVSQRALAHAAVEAGADAVVGGQAYHPQGIELDDGVPIFHSPGHLVFDPFSELEILDHPHSRKSLVVRLEYDADAGLAASAIPVYIGSNDQPRALTAGSDRFDSIVNWIIECSALAQDEYVVTEDSIELRL